MALFQFHKFTINSYKAAPSHSTIIGIKAVKNLIAYFVSNRSRFFIGVILFGARQPAWMGICPFCTFLEILLGLF